MTGHACIIAAVAGAAVGGILLAGAVHGFAEIRRRWAEALGRLSWWGGA